jgi:hypothetical protein
MESTVSIDQFHEVLQSWKHELTSFKHEIRHFERHLENLSSKRLPKDQLAQVEHFQNSFICQKEVIDKLRHDLPDSPHKVEDIYKGKRLDTEQGQTDAQALLGERMDIFRRIYSEVRNDFKKFEEELV